MSKRKEKKAAADAKDLARLEKIHEKYGTTEELVARAKANLKRLIESDKPKP